jgi:hypothetical protein
MTRDELRVLGEAWKRRGWQTHLARSLPVNPRTVRRWLAGERKIHPAMEERIRSLLSQPLDKMGNLGKKFSYLEEHPINSLLTVHIDFQLGQRSLQI